MLYLRSFSRFILISLALLGLSVSSVFAAIVPIINPSFELSLGQVDGWIDYNPNGISYGPGNYPPEAKTALVDDFYNPPGPIPPDLEEVAFIFVGSAFGDGVVGLQQTLSSKLMANTRYDLSVAVGNPQSAFSPRSLRDWNFDGFPGYGIELLVGDSVLVGDINLTTIAEGDFETISLSFTADNSHALLLGGGR